MRRRLLRNKDGPMRPVYTMLSPHEYLWLHDEAKRLKKPKAVIFRKAIVHYQNCAKVKRDEPSTAAPAAQISESPDSGEDE